MVSVEASCFSRVFSESLVSKLQPSSLATAKIKKWMSRIFVLDRAVLKRSTYADPRINLRSTGRSQNVDRSNTFPKIGNKS
jgi:hypothetical protein